MIKHLKNTVVGTLCAAALIAGPARAGVQLSSSVSELRISELLPGATYSLVEAKKAPLRVRYAGPSGVAVRIEPVRPNAGDLKPGYEPIPDTSWVSVVRSSFAVTHAPARFETDVRIRVPPGAAHAGKRYQAMLRIDAVSLVTGSPSAISIALESRLLISIAGAQDKP